MFFFMTEENKQTQILSTPFSRAYDKNQINDDDEIDVMCAQLRVNAVEAIREYRMGIKPLENLLNGLQMANKLFRESGWPEVEFNPDLE
jgi:hypothetical protein